MLEYQSEIIGKNPRKLIIFLHGYNCGFEDNAEAVDLLKKHLQNTVLCFPLAPEVSDKNPAKKQWFGMIKYDKNKSRYKPETSVEEIINIYNKTADEIAKRAETVNAFIFEMCEKYKIPPENTYIIGFSQGAMLALYTGLSAENKYGGIFMLSGIVAAEKQLAENINSKPEIHLFHGEKDQKVQFKTLKFTDSWLNNHHIRHTIYTYNNLEHKISEAEIEQIQKILLKKA